MTSGSLTTSGCSTTSGSLTTSGCSTTSGSTVVSSATAGAGSAAGASSTTSCTLTGVGSPASSVVSADSAPWGASGSSWLSSIYTGSLPTVSAASCAFGRSGVFGSPTCPSSPSAWARLSRIGNFWFATRIAAIRAAAAYFLFIANSPFPFRRFSQFCAGAKPFLPFPASKWESLLSYYIKLSVCFQYFPVIFVHFRTPEVGYFHFLQFLFIKAKCNFRRLKNLLFFQKIMLFPFPLKVTRTVCRTSISVLSA